MTVTPLLQCTQSSQTHGDRKQNGGSLGWEKEARGNLMNAQCQLYRLKRGMVMDGGYSSTTL